MFFDQGSELQTACYRLWFDFIGAFYFEIFKTLFDIRRVFWLFEDASLLSHYHDSRSSFSLFLSIFRNKLFANSFGMNEMIISIHRFELTLQYHINSHLSYNETSVRNHGLLFENHDNLTYVHQPSSNMTSGKLSWYPTGITRIS